MAKIYLTSELFTEKYRPKNINEIITPEKEKILNFLKNPNKLPHFLFYGSAGNGKSTLARAIILNLNSDNLILNGSDERKIDDIRIKVKPFISSLRLNKNIPKIVLIEEADYLGIEAQNSLRSLMEIYSNNARFIFTLNNIEKIIEPLISRCVNIKFQSPDKNNILDRLRFICKNENIIYVDEALKKIIIINYPDIRAIINHLQELSQVNNNITLNLVKDKEEQEQYIYGLLKAKKFREAREYWLSNGLNYDSLLKTFADNLFNDKEIKNKADIFIQLGNLSWQLGLAIDKELCFAGGMLNVNRLL